jgi:hypothetical protein
MQPRPAQEVLHRLCPSLWDAWNTIGLGRSEAPELPLKSVWWLKPDRLLGRSVRPLPISSSSRLSMTLTRVATRPETITGFNNIECESDRIWAKFIAQLTKKKLSQRILFYSQTSIGVWEDNVLKRLRNPHIGWNGHSTVLIIVTLFYDDIVMWLKSPPRTLPCKFALLTLWNIFGSLCSFHSIYKRARQSALYVSQWSTDFKACIWIRSTHTSPII